MQFNLKQHLAKQAANLNTTTEGQLANKGKAPNSLSEVQLKKSRSGEPDAIAEKQLDAARAKKSAPTSTTEAQLDGYGKTPKDNDGKSPGSTTEKQLKDNQVGGSTAPVEKRLDNVRTASDNGHDCQCSCGATFPCNDMDCNATSTHEETCPECLAKDRKGKKATFNLKEFLSKQAAKKDKSNQVTEGQLGERGKNEPDTLTDAQLDGGRKDTKPVTTQALLEKARTGEADTLVEARLDSSKSKLVQHRNPDASKGDMNKLEEQRLKAKKTAEGEKYEPASETDKGLMLPKVDGKDGLKTASRFWQTKVAQTMAPPSIQSPAEDPVSDDQPLVYEDDVQDVTVGQTTMKQITVRFDPSQIIDALAAETQVSNLLFSTHPSLRAQVQSGRLNLSKSISLDMDEGRATVMLPAEAFNSSPVV